MNRQADPAATLQQQRDKAHAWLDQLSPAKLGAIHNLLKVLIDDGEEEELTEEDRRALRTSDEYFRNGGQGVPMEEVLADFGLKPDDCPLKK